MGVVHRRLAYCCQVRQQTLCRGKAPHERVVCAFASTGGERWKLEARTGTFALQQACCPNTWYYIYNTIKYILLFITYCLHIYTHTYM